jgi:cysteine desulfurase / selenocysteine lyase
VAATGEGRDDEPHLTPLAAHDELDVLEQVGRPYPRHQWRPHRDPHVSETETRRSLQKVGGYDWHVAVTTRPRLDAAKLRADFPVFDHPVHGKPLAFLDSAVTSQKPRRVLDAMREFYETSYSNVHRGVYTLSERATEGYEGAREKVRAFVNASSTREVIFTRQATEALNLVAYAWGLDNLGPGDLALVTELEHHSNFVPWQQIAKRTGAEFRMIPIDNHGELRMDLADDVVGDLRVKVVAANLVSNSLGTINPIERLAAWAHQRGAIMVVDAAQAAPHRRIDVQTLGADFVAFSSHKMCGPTGVGVLWGRRELLEAMSPFNYGGSMIRSVKVEDTQWNELPYKFEAGTPAIAEAYGLGVAIDYLQAIGLEAIEEHEHELAVYALERLSELPFVTVYGPPPDRRVGLVSFNVDAVHPHDVAQVLDWEGIAIRAGHHCCQPLMSRLGVAATNRASFYLYTIPDEIDRLVAGLQKAKDVLG